MRNGITKTVSLETKDETEAIRRALEIADDPKLALSRNLLTEIDDFIDFKLSRDEFSRFSAENKKLTLKRFARWIGEESVIPKIKTEDFQRFYNEERMRVTESTVQGYMMCLRSFFGWLCKERKVISKNPTIGISMGRWDYGTKEDFCTPEIRDALLDGWKTIPENILPKNQALEIGFIVHAGFESGLRKNEIIECRPDWINLESRSIRVKKTETFRPKDREARSIPLTDEFISFLTNFSMDGQWCIAPDCKRGKSRYRYDFKRPLEKYISCVGASIGQDLSWVTPHIMRHTFASLLAIAGESLHKISVWLGDDPRVVDRHYAHLRDGDRAINSLHSFSPQKPPPSKLQIPRGKSVSNKPGIHRSRRELTGGIESLA